MNVLDTISLFIIYVDFVYSFNTQYAFIHIHVSWIFRV